MEKLKMKKGSLWLYIAILAVVVTAMVVLYRTSQRRGIIGSENGPAIKVGIQISPMGVSTDSDTLGGFCYDMIRLMAEREHLNLDIDGFVQMSDGLRRLDNGIYDIVIGDIPETTDLRDKYLFTESIYADREVLVQIPDSLTGEIPYKSATDLRSATVHIPAGSPFLQRLRNLSHEIGDTIFVIQDPEYGPEQMMILTALGEIPNVVVNSRQAAAMAREYPELDYSLDMSFNQFQSWAVAADNESLLDSLNLWIARFRDTDAYRELTNRYFNEHLPQ